MAPAGARTDPPLLALVSSPQSPQGLLETLGNHSLLSTNLTSIWLPCIKSLSFSTHPILRCPINCLKSHLWYRPFPNWKQSLLTGISDPELDSAHPCILPGELLLRPTHAHISWVNNSPHDVSSSWNTSLHLPTGTCQITVCPSRVIYNLPFLWSPQSSVITPSFQILYHFSWYSDSYYSFL